MGNIIFSSDQIKYFWDRVDKSAGPNSCWPWMASTVRGYGQITLSGRHYKSHRIAKYLECGELCPDGMFVCHRCNNPICCNPKHLRYGTPESNAHDRCTNSSNTNVYAASEQAIAIRKEYCENSVPIYKLAKKYGLSESSIVGIVYGKTFRSTPGPITQRPEVPKKAGSHAAFKIREDFATGEYSQTQLAHKYKLSKATVGHILHGDVYRNVGGPIVHHRKKRSTVDADIVGQVRQLYSDGVMQKEIAQRFGITQSGVSGIISGKAHEKAGGPTFKREVGIRRHNLHLMAVKPEDREHIRQLLKTGKTQRELADMFHVGHTTIYYIAHEKD